MKEMTTQIAAAYLRHTAIAPKELPGLIETIHAALCKLDLVLSPVVAPTPAVPIKKSISPAAITCLECGSQHLMLKRHLTTGHGLTVDEYRAKWSLPVSYPMTAPDYAARRSALAVANGLGRRPGPAKASPKKKSRKKVAVK